ncbi:MAG TPA: hypothetical protein VK404_03450 [Spirosoma sp.]|jgi:hypothetical protein|nr:hypothetical protein [Spirosoma sp.]
MIKLFTIGDSISQGFMSGAAARTDLSYSTLLSKVFKIKGYDFPLWDVGGLPVNIEELFRRLEKAYGPEINPIEWTLALATTIPKYVDEIEDYYERGKGAADKPYPGSFEFFHNVAVRGFTVSDAWLVTGKYCQRVINAGRKNDGVYAMPNESLTRTALKVLNPSLSTNHENKSQLDWLKYHAQGQGVENAIVWLGANNALGTVVDLSLQFSPGDGSTANMPREELLKQGWNLWHPVDFEADYKKLLDKIDVALAGQATKVFLGTVPLVSIAPLAKGVGDTFGVPIKDDDGKVSNVTYFKYYTYFPFNEEYAFKTGINLSFTQVLHIDNCIREYNRIIKRLREEYNRRNPDRYHIVDMAEVLDQLAFKRNNGVPRYTFPDFFNFRYPTLNTKYYHVDQAGNLKQGGVFSLDGVHPTAIAHGLIAYEFLKVMQRVNVPGANPNLLDWDAIFASDALYQKPIRIMQEIYQNTHLAEWVLQIVKRLHHE